MTKIQVTAQQRANALDALNVMWPSVPPENVYPDLLDWRKAGHGTVPDCGTVACFGGWCEWWPPFREQMKLEPTHGCAGWHQATSLFGPSHERAIDCLFSIRHYGNGHPADQTFPGGTDHELVTNRLNWLIQNTEVVS